MQNVQAWGENAVIVSDDGHVVRYRYRCPNCGAVDVGLQTCSVSYGSSSSSFGNCIKCHKSFRVVIGRR